MVQTDTDANATTVTDQASKVRRSITNGLGQLIRVDEPTDSGLGTVSSPNQYTDYTYDVLNNLLQVDQGAQDRIFTYSSLSRLRTANNPESGTITYTYDNNGNLTAKVDARSITTTYAYDALNRVTDRDYSDSTPDVDYTYGTTAPKIGKLTKVTNRTGTDRSTTEYTAFDILGRVTAHKQTTDGVDYTTGYTYNLSGALIEETYPSGRVVKNVLDDNGDLSMVQSKKNSNAGYWNYAENFAYNAAGAVTSMQLGNGKWESTQFNSRLQPTQIAVGLTPGATNLLDLDYSYGTTANNGNVQSQTITVTRPGQSNLVFDQTYTYDSLNRIKSAEEKTGTTTNWKQTFTFDRYGNRNFDQANTTQPESFAQPNTTNPNVNASNNRFSSGQGWTYDAAGNVITDAEG
jgi:YD repeat-containing protein